MKSTWKVGLLIAVFCCAWQLIMVFNGMADESTHIQPVLPGDPHSDRHFDMGDEEDRGRKQIWETVAVRHSCLIDCCSFCICVCVVSDDGAGPESHRGNQSHADYGFEGCGTDRSTDRDCNGPANASDSGMPGCCGNDRNGNPGLGGDRHFPAQEVGHFLGEQTW